MRFSPPKLCPGNFSYTERFAVKYAGAAAMYFVSKKLKKKYNITDMVEHDDNWVGTSCQRIPVEEARHMCL
jgi:hypothetical protein